MVWVRFVCDRDSNKVFEWVEVWDIKNQKKPELSYLAVTASEEDLAEEDAIAFLKLMFIFSRRI